MAINALIAQGVRPIGADVAGLLINKRQEDAHNALANAQATREQTTFDQQQQDRTAQQAQAKQTQDAKQAVAEAQWLLSDQSGQDKVAAIHSLPHITAALQQQGIDTTQFTPDQVTGLAQAVLAKASSFLGQGPAAPHDQVVAPGGTLLRTPADGGPPQAIYTAPQAPITPAQQAQMDLTRRGQDLTNQREIDKAKAAQNPFGTTQSAGGAPQATSTGADFLTTLPSNISAQVKALAEGRMAFPTGFALRSAYWQGMLSAVSQYDPSFDAVNYNARAKTRADFVAGKNANNIKALNTGIGHAGTLYEQIAGTASHSLTPLNYLENKSMELTGSAGPTKFKQTSSALASELTAIFRGTGGAEADIKRYLDELNVNGSLEQKKAAVQNIMALLRSRTLAIGDQYNQGMGTTKDPLTLLNPHAQDVIRKIVGSDASATASSDVPAISNDADYARLPSGAQYTAPDGSIRTKR